MSPQVNNHLPLPSMTLISHWEESPDTINILPGFVSPADIRYLKEVVADFELKATILPDISETMDGVAAKTYDKIQPGGTPLAAIKTMGSNLATLEFGHTMAEETAKAMARMGVDLFNCMAMLPNADTPFADLGEPDKPTMNALRNKCEKHLPQMRHCKRCRADAVGLLGKDRSGEMAGCLNACATMPAPTKTPRPYVAVSSMEGMLVNQHLGETTKFLIYGQEGDGYKLIEERPAPMPGGGIGRWQALTRLLYDCRAVLVSDMGESPRQIFQEAGIKPITMTGFIESGLKGVYTGEGLNTLKRRAKKSCSQGGCQGTGTGCG